MGMILRIASSRIVGQGDIVGRSGYFSLNLSANSVMRGRLDARRTLKSLVADLRYTPLAQLEVDFYIGKIVTDEDKDGLEKGVGGYYPTSKRMMDKVVDKAKMLGADGIVCFKVQYFPQTKYSQAFYQATGVAVKVKK